MLYTGYVGNVRRYIAEVDIPLERAIDFLHEVKNGIIVDSSGTVFTL